MDIQEAAGIVYGARPFVVVSWDRGSRPVDGPEMAIGPFATEAEANELRDLAARTTSGHHKTVRLFTPTDSLLETSTRVDDGSL